MRIFVAQINQTIGDLEGNTARILAALKRAREKKADIVLFPELALSGYFPEDLLLDRSLIDAVEEKLEVIRPATMGLFAVVGLPRWNPNRKEKPLYNSAAVFENGKLLGFKNKTLLPTYDVFDERRYFEPDEEQPIWTYLGCRIAITICEDVWQHSAKVGYTDYFCDPVEILKEKSPDLVLNLSASPYYFNRKDVRLSALQSVAKTLCCPVILCNQVGGNDQLIFDGHSLYLNEKGEMIQIAKGFAEEDLVFELNTHACPCPMPENGIRDLYNALVLGVRDYLHKQGFKKGVLGLSGGIDSAVVACIAKEALGAENVLAVSLPSRYSSEGSVSDAVHLAKNLGIELRKVSIDSVFQSYLDLLNPLFQDQMCDLAEENIQSRIRGAILMAFSNQYGPILLNAGNKSEMAMGYTTLYGDMAGGLGVLHDVTKMHVYQLAHLINRGQEMIPKAILTKAPSAELKPNQKDSDSLPPYEILDPIIEDYIEELLTPEQIAEKRKLPIDFVRNLTHKMHLAEYKRRQAPISLRVTQKAFNKGRIIPIVQKWR